MYRDGDEQGKQNRGEKERERSMMVLFIIAARTPSLKTPLMQVAIGRYLGTTIHGQKSSPGPRAIKSQTSDGVLELRITEDYAEDACLEAL